MIILPHQDDEMTALGILQRIGEARLIWVTNGDGLAPSEGADPRSYAEGRKAETDEVLTLLGRSLESRKCLDYSEIEIYDHFIALENRPQHQEETLSFFEPIGSDIYREIREYRPDVVWTCAFQNGHPEHDLTHLMTAYAIRQIQREQNRSIDFYQFPEYEYTVLIPLRFHPLYADVVHRLDLTPAERELKHRALGCYHSQKEGLDTFMKVVSAIGRVACLFGKGFTAEEYVGVEDFAPVSHDLDYSLSTHRFEWANYMFEVHKGLPVRFKGQVSLIAEKYKGWDFK